MLIIPAMALVLLFSMFMTAVLRPPARPAALLSAYLLAYANIVLVGQITNSFYQLNRPWLWLVLHGVMAVVSVLVWWLARKPSLLAPWKGFDGRIIPASFRSSLRSWPDLWILGLGVSLAFAFSLVLLWIMPPNNNDSLATHMSRIGYWMQRGSFFPWSTQRVWQITYPVNMQLQMFWTVLFIGNDRLVEIVQWLGALAAMVAVFGLARLLGASRPQAAFAALLWATLPEIILESTTTQNDLVAGTLFAALLYLLFLGLYRRHQGMLALSGLALGLGLGTKQTLLFLMPGLALTLLLVLWYQGRSRLPGLLAWAGYGLAAFLLVGAYMFVVNQVRFGHPMGPETAVNAQTGGQNVSSLQKNLTYNTVRLAYQSIDPTGLPDTITGYSFKLKALIVGKLARAVRFPLESDTAVAAGHQFVLRERYVVQEDAAWYGPLLALLIWPALLYQLVVGLKRKDPLRVGIFLLSLTFLLIDAAFRPGWDPFQGRYFIPVVTIAAALAAFIANRSRWAVVARWLVVIVALMVTYNTFQSNSGKPISGQRTIWSMDWLDRATIQSFYMRTPARMVEKQVPADATMGLLTYGTYLEYPFFHSDYSRRLIQIFPPEQVEDMAWLKEQGIEYILVQVSPEVPGVRMPPDLVPVANTGNWTLFTWAP